MLPKTLIVGLVLFSCSCADFDDELSPNEEAADHVSRSFAAGNLTKGKIQNESFDSAVYAYHRWSVDRAPDLMRVTIDTNGTFIPAMQVGAHKVRKQGGANHETIVTYDWARFTDLGDNVYVGNVLLHGPVQYTPVQLVLTSDAVAKTLGSDAVVDSDAAYSIEVVESPAVQKVESSAFEVAELELVDGKTRTNVTFAEGKSRFITRLNVKSQNGRLIGVSRVDANGSATPISDWDLISSGEGSGYVWVGNEAAGFELEFEVDDGQLRGLEITPFEIAKDDVSVQEIHRPLL